MSAIATAWAAVSPPNERSGQRYIFIWGVRPTKRSAREAFVGGDTVHNWAHYRKKGWTIERVCVTTVQSVKTE